MPEDKSLPRDPEAFEMQSRNPVDWSQGDWDQQAFALLNNYLYPDDQTEEETETREDILVYCGRGRLGDFFSRAEGSPAPGEGEGWTYGPQSASESADNHTVHWTTAKEPGKIADETVTVWLMRRGDIESVELKVGEDGEPIDITEDSETYFHPFVIRDGGASLWWIMTAAIWIEKIQVGRRAIDDPEALRPELVRLLRRAVKEGPFIRLTMEDGSKIDPNERVCRQLLRTANRLDGGARVARLAIRADNLEDLPTWTPPEERDNAPAPRPSPNPFDMATGLAKVPSGEFTRSNLRGISGEGEWLEDSFGRPVYRYTFQGPPWGGNAQLSVKQAIETDAAWKMLRDGKGEDRPTQFHADAVTLYYLFLAYASDQAPKNRPGPDEGFRIQGEDVLRILNLPDNGEWDRQRKVRHIYNLNSYLNSFQIQLNRITYQGERKRTDAISPAQLWDTYLRGVEKKDLHGNVTNIEFSVEGREGAWADLFLHDSDTWTPFGSLPIRVLEDMDGRNRYSRLILFHILILFRVEGGTVRRTGDDLLKWCRVVPDELSRQQISRRRSTIQNALEELKQQGFQIDDSRLRAAKGTPLSDWQGQAVCFYPPPDIVDACPQIEAPEGQLPEPRSETWTGKRVRDLRKHIGEYQSEFGGRLPNREGGMGVKQPRVSTIESGNHPLTERQEKKLDELAKEFGFDG